MDCGETDPAKLEFGHTTRKDWKPHKTARWVRVAKVGREALDMDENGRLVTTGKIVLQCGTCNKKAGQPDVVDTGPDPDW